jgi:hypothetical protein
MTYYTLLTHGFIENKKRLPIQKNSSSKKIPIIMYGTQGETTYPDTTIVIFFLFSKLFGEPFLKEVVRALRQYPENYEAKYKIVNRSSYIKRAVQILFLVNLQDRTEMNTPQNKFRIFTSSNDPDRQPFNLKLETFIPHDKRKLSQAQIGRFDIEKKYFQFIRQTVDDDDILAKLCIRKNEWPFEQTLSLRKLLKKKFVNSADVITLNTEKDKKLWIRFEEDDGYILLRHLIPLGLYKTDIEKDIDLQAKHVDSFLSTLLSDLKKEDSNVEALFIFSCKEPTEKNMKLYLPEIYNLLLHDLIDEKDLDKIKFKKNMTVAQLEKYVKSIVSKKLKRKQKKQRNTMQNQDRRL